jgi:hypothetical protein
MDSSLLPDSVNLSWVACWADALDLQPSIECTWVGSFFFISINRVQFVAKIQCNKLYSFRCHRGLHWCSKFYFDPDSGVSAIMMDIYQNMSNLLALQWYLGSDAHNILHNLLANRGCHHGWNLWIALGQSFWTGMYELLLKNQRWGGIVLKKSVDFQCPRSWKFAKEKSSHVCR